HVKDRASTAAESVTDTARNVAGAVTEYVNQAKDKAQSVASQAIDTANKTAESVQTWTGDACDKTGAALKGAGEELTGWVRRYALPAIAVGLGIGYLLGRVARNSS